MLKVAINGFGRIDRGVKLYIATIQITSKMI